MSCFRAVHFLCLLAFVGTVAARQTQSVTPVQKVIAMMEDMKAKGVQAKQDEAEAMEKFEKFCHETEITKERAIKKGGEASERLAADAEKYDSDAAVLSEEIAELDSLIDAAEADKSEATAIRDKEHADFARTQAEYNENIGDLQAAVTRVKSMMNSGGAAAASLLQTLATKPHMPSRAKRVIESFLSTSRPAGIKDERDARLDPSQRDISMEVEAPEAASFESQSGGIVTMMEQLHEKLKDEKTDLEKDEADKQHAFDVMAQSLTDQVEEQSAARNKKASSMKKAEMNSAQAKGDLARTQDTMAEDTKYLEDLKTMRATKNQEFEARSKMRTDELEALDKAIEIISSGSVSGAADSHLPALVQQNSASMLMQLRSSSDATKKQAAAASFLKLQGQKQNSQVLLALAARVSEDPFSKVKKMIKDMVVKLMEEANEEAEHKGFCDTEMSTNKQTRDAKTTEVDELTASIERMGAQSQKLATEVSMLSDQITEIDAAVAKATAIRVEEKEKNTQAIADAKAASAAVEQATSVLKEFYDKAAGATALAQMQAGGVADDVPETFDKPFTGTGGEGGILGMLEVILSDFQRLESETTSEEDTNQRDFEQFSADSSKDKAVKNMDIKHKSDEKSKLDSDAATAKADLKSAQEELNAAMKYFEKLKPSCVDAGESYEERVARRKEEIESLHEALEILSQ